MAKTISVHGQVTMKLMVDPIEVIKQINIIPEGDWIVVSKHKYIHMTEVSAGSHSHDKEVGEVSEEIFDAYMAKETLIKFLTKS